MFGHVRAHRLCALAAACAAMIVVPAQARPFTVEDLLRQASFGPVVVDPASRWMVFEQRDPYRDLPRFDYSTRNDAAGSRLRIVDLRRPTSARPLLADSDGPGDMALAVSPDGERIAIQRLQDRRLELGVVTVATGAVRWLGLTPEDPYTNRAVQWRSTHELVVLARPDGDLPLLYRVGGQSAAELPGRWATTAAGGVSATVIGSGAAKAVRERPAPSHLLAVDVRTGTRRSLASGEIVDFELSPDSERVAWLEAGEDLQPQGDAVVQSVWGMQTERRILSVLDIRSGRRTSPLPDADVLDSLLSWRGDSEELLVFSRPTGAPWSAGCLRRIAMTRPDARCATPPGLTVELRLRPERVSAAWMGLDPVVLARPATPDARPDWFRLPRSGPIKLTGRLDAPPGPLFSLSAERLSVLAEGSVWRFDASGRLRARVGHDLASAAWPRPSRARRLGELPPPSDAPVSRTTTLGPALADPVSDVAPVQIPAHAVPVAYAPDGGAVIATSRTAEGVETMMVLRPHAPPVVVATLNGHLADVPAPRLVAVDTLGPDGGAVRSWVYLPPEPTPGAPPPALIVRPYLGETYPHPYTETRPPGALFANIRVMVGQGHAVLIPGLPRRRDAREPLAGLADRVLAVVDAAAAQPDLKGAFDPQRLALWGHSYGGYSVLGILTQTRRFRAAVASAPPTNLLSFGGTFQPSWRVAPRDGVWVTWPAGWVETAQGAMGGPPWASPERYVRNSPALLANRIETPVLLFHGDQDPVSVTQSEQMFSALYRQGKTAQIVTYWGEDHILNSPGTVRDLYGRGFAWIERFLAPVSVLAAPPSASPATGSASDAPSSR